MASKATQLKKSIRRLNATIDTHVRVLNKGNAHWIEAINDPTFPNITVAGMHRAHEANQGRRNMVRFACQRLATMQAELIALNNKAR